MAKTPSYAVQRASSDDYSKAQLTASPKADLLGHGDGDTENDLQAIIQAELPDALQFIDTEMGSRRAKATEYYHGDPFGNEEEGRSKVVSRDVLAVVQSLMPSIMRTFWGGRWRIRYRPITAADVAGAEQATYFVNSVTMRLDNDGFLEFHAAVKDALIRFKGVFKVWLDDAKEVTTDTYTGQDEDGLMVLANDPEITEIRTYKEAAVLGQPQTYAAIATRTVHHVNKIRFGCVPPEELLVNRDARSIRTARFLDHRRVMSLGELVALGYDRETLMPYTNENTLIFSPEVLARAPHGVATLLPGSGLNPAELARPITYHEVYTRADMDGDDYPELLRVCGAGDGATFHLLHWEPVSEVPFAAIDADPEPHALFGLCPGGNVMDVQLVKSALIRMQMDGAALALDPRLAVVEHMVELDDLLNPEVGGLVRTKAPGQIEPLRYDFNPIATQGLLDYMDQVIEDRTGRSRASQGLDADAVQSSTKLAVASVLSSAQQQQEMICRLFAESGVKDLYRLILRFLVRHSNQERMIKFRGEWTAVDPRTWNSDMEVDVEIAVGVGGVEMQIQALRERKATQEMVLTTYTLNNPLVTLGQYRATVAQLEELLGLPDADEAYKAIPADWQPPAVPAAPSEAQVLQETAMQELALKEKIETGKLALEQTRILLEDQRERIKIANTLQGQLANAVGRSRQAGATVDVAQFESAAAMHGQELEHEAALVEHLVGGAVDAHVAETQAAAQTPAAAPPADAPPPPAPEASNG